MGVAPDILAIIVYFIYPRCYTGGMGIITVAVSDPIVWVVTEFKLVCMVCIFLLFLYVDNASTVQTRCIPF